MIEVEQKFVLAGNEQAQLLAGAAFVNEKTIRDVYFDRLDFSISTKNSWLRKRNGGWEVKISLSNQSTEQSFDNFKELTNENDIRKFLRLERKESLTADINKAGYIEIANIVTTRQTYKIDEFIIAIDQVQNTGYRLAEIELNVKHEQEMNQAKTKITEFAKSRGLVERPIKGKVYEYIREHNPVHYVLLQKAGIIRE